MEMHDNDTTINVSKPSESLYGSFYEDHLDQIKKGSENQIYGLCPFHDDHKASFSANTQSGVWQCHGCYEKGNAHQFAEKMEISPSLVPSDCERKTIAATYPYKDENGELLFESVRYTPKEFRQRRPNGKGGYEWNLKGVRRVLYRLPELLREASNQPYVFIAEGEKDVDSLRGLGFTATCNPMGAGKWKPEYADSFKSLQVIIIADKDEAGRAHAQNVAVSLQGKAASVKILEFAGETVKDASDWIDQGGIHSKLMELVASAPLWSAPTTPSPFLNLNEEEMETVLPFESVTLEGLLGESSDTEIEWKVQGILPKESVSILAGPAGYGKSFLLLDLAIEVSRGGKWLGCFPTTPGPVLYIDEESARSLIRSRLRKLCSGKNMPVPPTNIHLVLQKGLHLDDSQSKSQLIASIWKFRPSLIVMDSLIRVHDADENSATEMSKVFAVVRSIASQFGCAIIFADHQRKQNGFAVSPEQLVRGSSDKSASVDTLLCLQRSDGNLIIDHAKSRFAEAVKSFVVRIEDDATKQKITVKHVGDAESLKQKVRLSAARTFLEQYFATNGTEWATRKTIVEAGQEHDLSEKMVDAALQEIKNEGFIERKDEKPAIGKGGKQAYYRLKDTSDPAPAIAPTPSPSSPIYAEETETKSNGTSHLYIVDKSVLTSQFQPYSPPSNESPEGPSNSNSEVVL